jgi:penicillin-binding protein 1A
MKACYADESLNVSKDEFEKPEELSINVDCDIKDEGDLSEDIDPLDEVDVDF